MTQTKKAKQMFVAAYNANREAISKYNKRQRAPGERYSDTMRWPEYSVMKDTDELLTVLDTEVCNAIHLHCAYLDMIEADPDSHVADYLDHDGQQVWAFLSGI